MTGTRNRSLKRLLVLIVVLVFIAAISVTAIRYFNGDRIKQLIVAELNKHLLAPVNIGSIDIAIFRSFPSASVILENTTMKPPADLPGAPGLIHADKIILKFNLIDLLTGNYTIHSVDLSNAHLSIFEDGYGHNNYDIWKGSSGSKEGDVTFDIRKLTLKSSKIFYRNQRRKDDIAIDAIGLVLKGSFQKKEYSFNVQGDCYNQRMIIGNAQILPKGAATVESIVDINTSVKIVGFTKSAIDFEGIAIAFNGKYNYSTVSTVDFYVTSLSSQISKLQKILPDDIKNELVKYNPEGSIEIHGRFNGPAGDITALKVSAGYEIKKAHIQYGTKKVIVDDVMASGNFFYGGKKYSEVLNIKNFSGKVKSGKFKGTSVISNFSKPRVKLELHVNTDFAELLPFIENKAYDRFKGTLIADINYNGVYKAGGRADRNTTGQVIFSDAGFVYNKNEIDGLNGSLEFKDNKLYFNGLTCTIGKSDLKANGFIDNLVSYLLDEEQNIHASLRLYSDKLVLEDILGLAVTQGQASKQTSIFPPHITFDALLNVNSLTYKKLITKSITGTFSLKDDILRGSEIQINALDGRIFADGIINGRYGNRAQIVTKADFKGVDINKLFYQFDDFGQKSLVSSNLKGTADASVNFATSLYSNYTVNTESVEAIADITIRDGELSDFEPLQALSRFLDADDLKNVKFETLSNRIEISHKTVLIPQMEIRSSALNLAGNGTHTFGNDIDYHVNMLLSDVMRAKRKKPAEIDKYIEDDGLGKPRLFLKITGPISDPLVQYDVKAVRGKIADDFKKEKQVFKEVIQKEFGRKKTSETQAPAATKQNDKTEFQIEWDETK